MGVAGYRIIRILCKGGWMPRARLSKLILQNYKSVPFASINFSGMTFIVGRNGTGKSNIADAFAFLAEAMEQPLQSVINRRGGPTNLAHKEPTHLAQIRHAEHETLMGIAVEFSDLPSYHYPAPEGKVRGRYALEIATSPRGYRVLREQCSISNARAGHIWIERDMDGIRSNVEVFQGIGGAIVTPKTLLLQVFGGVLDFAPLTHAIKSMAIYAIEPATLREFQNHDSGDRLLPDGSNSASVLKVMSEKNPTAFRRLIQVLGSIIPDLGDIRSISVGRKQVLRFYQSWNSEEFGKERLSFDAFNMSDGTLRSFGILLAVFQESRPSLILIEEPETSIHPGATGAILELLRGVELGYASYYNDAQS